MSRLVRMVAFLLLTLWVPATMHCQMEAAGLLPEELGCAEGESGHCEDTVCYQVEDSLYKNTSTALQVPPPSLREVTGCDTWRILTSLVARVVPIEMATDAPSLPRDWVVLWKFEQRAAPPARAPSWSTLCA